MTLQQPVFLDPLRIEKVGPRRWRLLRELRYVSILPDVGTLTVPEGFVTDLASVPRIPFAYWLAGGTADGPSVVHDFWYNTRLGSRRLGDAVFYEAATVSQPALGYEPDPWWRRALMWAALRLFGWWPWRQHRKRAPG